MVEQTLYTIMWVLGEEVVQGYKGAKGGIPECMCCPVQAFTCWFVLYK